MTVRRLMSAAGIAVLMLGCSGSDDGDAPDDVQPDDVQLDDVQLDDVQPDGVPPRFIVWTEPIPDSLDAPVWGVVQIETNGCVYLASSPDGPREPAIWPFGTTFDGTVIRTTDGVEIRDGDSIESGGGEVEYAFEYYVDNTTLATQVDLMLECGEIDGDRITAFNPLASIVVVAE